MQHEPKCRCNEYREEMILLGLKRRLAGEDLPEELRRELIVEIEKLESAITMD